MPIVPQQTIKLTGPLPQELKYLNNCYHKINSIYKRENSDNGKKLIIGNYSLDEFEYLAKNQWIFTEKIDGTNIRVIYNPHTEQIEIRGRSNNAVIPSKLQDKLFEIFSPQYDYFKEAFGEQGVILFGEGYGAGIQKGGGNYLSNKVDFVLFDVVTGGWILKRENVNEIAKKIGIRSVPIVGEGTLDDAITIVKNKMISQWGEFEAEGIVACPKVDLKARNGSRIIVKIKGKDFKNEK